MQLADSSSQTQDPIREEVQKAFDTYLNKGVTSKAQQPKVADAKKKTKPDAVVVGDKNAQKEDAKPAAEDKQAVAQTGVCVSVLVFVVFVHVTFWWR